MRILLPFTMAVTTALVIKRGNGDYAIPFDMIRELIKIPGQSLVTIGGRLVTNFRGSVLDSPAL